jgi:hypothetical protein
LVLGDQVLKPEENAWRKFAWHHLRSYPTKPSNLLALPGN